MHEDDAQDRHVLIRSDSLATDLPLEASTCENMSQQASQANHAYDSDANMDGRTDDEQEHQEPPASKEQQRVSSCLQHHCGQLKANLCIPKWTNARYRHSHVTQNEAVVE